MRITIKCVECERKSNKNFTKLILSKKKIVCGTSLASRGTTKPGGGGGGGGQKIVVFTRETLTCERLLIYRTNPSITTNQYIFTAVMKELKEPFHSPLIYTKSVSMLTGRSKEKDNKWGLPKEI